jgi:hypothetical protein
MGKEGIEEGLHSSNLWLSLTTLASAKFALLATAKLVYKVPAVFLAKHNEMDVGVLFLEIKELGHTDVDASHNILAVVL